MSQHDQLSQLEDVKPPITDRPTRDRESLKSLRNTEEINAISDLIDVSALQYHSAEMMEKIEGRIACMRDTAHAMSTIGNRFGNDVCCSASSEIGIILTA
jgi:hypothetical protein